MKEEQARKIVIRIESRAGADAMLRVCSRGGARIKTGEGRPATSVAADLRNHIKAVGADSSLPSGS